ncbi:hypothetical protein COLO4_25091 [Corchorus olitorius]|uniref:Uncharacterized protein n=1 Tax=Corchorus olitorius TaxID=93759 RepID=A0A1R3I4Q3_9ROSI|nr:hypothetical protein COLO4_25091 [Corchorus olitorius]
MEPLNSLLSFEGVIHGYGSRTGLPTGNGEVRAKSSRS